MEGIIRMLRRFAAATVLISIFLLLFNFVLLGTLIFKEIKQHPSPESVVREVAQHLTSRDNGYRLSGHSVELLQQNQAWAMLLGEDGRVRWDYRLPDDVPRSFNLVEVAKFSRYYLMDYPVYIWEHEEGAVVVGYPKNSYGKYQLNFLYDWIRSLPQRLVLLLLLNAGAALLLSVWIGARLLKGIRPLIAGVHRLAREEAVHLDSKGIFGDLARSINAASSKLQHKTAALKSRDEARSNWIAGISHDIRTPLSMILGYASEMEDNADVPAESRHQAGIIRRQGEKLRSLVSDLNLVSMLEYEMHPLRMKPVRLSVLARQVAADCLNDGLDERYELVLNLEDEAVRINGDEKLLLRAIGNLVQNSIRHNPEGCKIVIETSLLKGRSRYCLAVKDDGRGIPQHRLAEITELPYSSRRKHPVQQGHGLGLPMVSRIAKAHNGRLLIENGGGADRGGLHIKMEIPVLD